ncbi:zinc metallopeptidase [Thermococcus sp. M36]|uniref:M48 family metallopeptidase n=1 Tax=Thermococcus sp. M36 TaxID=1638261 RepID=UPI0014394744|nr:M48 family metalloprotease [Thermococcus sp. M36]NJE05267.1 zinc metallopeptidase [Thermococcus sp. M36]
MLLAVIVLEGLLAVIALEQLGLEISLAAFALILTLYFWVSKKDIKGDYVLLQQEEMPWLYEGIAEMARKAGISMPTVYILDDYIPLAYSFKDTIVLSLGLFEVLDEDEILAVAAHEIGHIKNGDTRLFPVLAYSRYLMITFTVVLVILTTSLWTAVAAVILYGMYELSRANFLKDREFLADETALKLLDVPMSLMKALEELKYYEDLRSGAGVRVSAVPSIEPAIERRQKVPRIETHPSYDERIFRILVEINGSNMFNRRMQ